MTLSLGKIWYRCVDTVRGERWSSLPISLFVSPRAARLAILACCGVSRSAVVPDGRPSSRRPVERSSSLARANHGEAWRSEKACRATNSSARASAILPCLCSSWPWSNLTRAVSKDQVSTSFCFQRRAERSARVAHARDSCRRCYQKVHPGRDRGDACFLCRSHMCSGIRVPACAHSRFDQIQDNPERVRDVGLQFARAADRRCVYEGHLEVAASGRREGVGVGGVAGERHSAAGCRPPPQAGGQVVHPVVLTSPGGDKSTQPVAGGLEERDAGFLRPGEPLGD